MSFTVRRLRDLPSMLATAPALDPTGLQHACGAQMVDVGRGQAENLAVYLGIVLPQWRPEMLDAAW